jgi:hypothetical protein
MMFIGFPMDFVHTRHLDKAVAFFGQLVHWHVESALSRVIVKVLMNDDAKIPVRFLATCGSVGNTRSFTVIVVHLQEDGFTFLGNESPLPEHGFPNLLPASPQRWMAHAGDRCNVSVDAENEARVAAVQMDEMEDDQNSEFTFVPVFDDQNPLGVYVVPTPVIQSQGVLQNAVPTPFVRSQTVLQSALPPVG